MKTIKIGIIGAGRIGRVHAENIAKFVPEMEIKTIADPYMSEETVEFLRRLRIPNIVKDADVILNDPEIKAVVVCSPTDLHAEYAIKVAEAGKDVFVEKPVDYRIDRVKEVIAAAKKKPASSSKWALTAGSTTTTRPFTRPSGQVRWAK